MKSMYSFTVCLVFLFLTTGAMNGQKIITQWNFNGPSPNDVPLVDASPAPSMGSGSAQLIGGVVGTFSKGTEQATPYVGSSDPVITTPNNYGWNTTSYASSKTENKQNGVQFNISTVGYKGIVFKFDQRLTNTANNTYVVQYTINRNADPISWSDAVMFTFAPAPTGTGETWYNKRTVDLTTVSALDNNPNVAIRVVSAFDPTVSNYVAAASTSSYTAGGTVRFDMVTVLAAQTLGVDSNVYKKQSFSFYPNPTRGNFIYFDQPVSVRIFDVMGKAIMSAKEVTKLNLESLTEGLYFIENEDKTVIKMIKNYLKSPGNIVYHG